ncbi:hypothetical protein C8R47DRAFT_437727 [Mycena vitilis]|nr:hypothetical protein C8R47DRAFT_437727 [Mycena vitilis]
MTGTTEPPQALSPEALLPQSGLTFAVASLVFSMLTFASLSWHSSPWHNHTSPMHEYLCRSSYHLSLQPKRLVFGTRFPNVLAETSTQIKQRIRVLLFFVVLRTIHHLRLTSNEAYSADRDNTPHNGANIPMISHPIRRPSANISPAQASNMQLRHDRHYNFGQRLPSPYYSRLLRFSQSFAKRQSRYARATYLRSNAISTHKNPLIAHLRPPRFTQPLGTALCRSLQSPLKCSSAQLPSRDAGTSADMHPHISAPRIILLRQIIIVAPSTVAPCVHR